MNNAIIKAIAENSIDLYKCYSFTDAETSSDLKGVNESTDSYSFSLRLFDVVYDVTITTCAESGITINLSSIALNKDAVVKFDFINRDRANRIKMDWTPDFSTVSTVDCDSLEINANRQSYAALTVDLYDLENIFMQDYQLTKALEHNFTMYNNEYLQRLGDLQDEESEQAHERKLSEFDERYFFVFDDESAMKEVRDLKVYSKPGTLSVRQYKVIDPTLELDSIQEIEIAYVPIREEYSIYSVKGDVREPLYPQYRTVNPNVVKSWLNYAIKEK